MILLCAVCIRLAAPYDLRAFTQLPMQMSMNPRSRPTFHSPVKGNKPNPMRQIGRLTSGNAEGVARLRRIARMNIQMWRQRMSVPSDAITPPRTILAHQMIESVILSYSSNVTPHRRFDRLGQNVRWRRWFGFLFLPL